MTTNNAFTGSSTYNSYESSTYKSITIDLGQYSYNTYNTKITYTCTEFIDAKNISLYTHFMTSIENKLEACIFDKITKEELDSFGLNYAYEKIEEFIDIIISEVIEMKKTSYLVIKDGEEDKVIDVLNKRIHRETFYRMIDDIFKTIL